MTCNRKFVLIKYCAVGFQNEKIICCQCQGDLPWGSWPTGVRTPPSTPVEKFSPAEKYLLDHTFAELNQCHG